MYGFLHSTEFLVSLFVVAALLVGLIVKPSRRGQAETSFARGELYPDADTTPRVEFRVAPDGTLEISRCGLTGLTSADSVSIAITRIGFDIDIQERIVRNDHARVRRDPAADLPAPFRGAFSTPSPYGLTDADAVGRAIFRITGLAPERYHIKYNSPAYSTFLAPTHPPPPRRGMTPPRPPGVPQPKGE